MLLPPAAWAGGLCREEDISEAGAGEARNAVRRDRRACHVRAL